MQMSEHVPVIKTLYHATKYIVLHISQNILYYTIYNVYYSAKIEAWLYSQGKITTATKSEINSQTKM